MKAQGENGHLLFFTQLLMVKMFGAVCRKCSYRMSKAEKENYLALKHTIKTLVNKNVKNPPLWLAVCFTR